MSLLLADIALDFLHVFVIVFNLTGWIWRRTCFAHRFLYGATAFCWIVVGGIIGAIGFCPLTEWHWKIKEARGIANLPYSYVDYLLQKIGLHFEPSHIDAAVAASFVGVGVITIALWCSDSGVKCPLFKKSKNHS